jgi:hypothetical protein
MVTAGSKHELITDQASVLALLASRKKPYVQGIVLGQLFVYDERIHRTLGLTTCNYVSAFAARDLEMDRLMSSRGCRTGEGSGRHDGAVKSQMDMMHLGRHAKRSDGVPGRRCVGS